MSVLETSARGASILILFQIASRGFTFLLNQVLLRFLSPEILGLSAQLELYSITVLFFARESVRVACQRQAPSIQTVVNFGFIPVILGTFLSYGLAVAYQKGQIPNVPYFVESLTLYGLSAILELLSEPSFIASQQLLLFRVRASAETVATIGRCLATCATAIWGSRSSLSLGVLPFAVGQITYSVLLLLMLVGQLSITKTSEKFSLWPTRIQKDEKQYLLGLFSKPLGILSLSLTVQNAFKYVLTQGDGVLIAALASLEEQGAYALASNYGGLIARMLFQPIEETSRTLFAQLCNTEDKSAKQKPNLTSAKDLLESVVKLYSILGLIAVSVGPTAAPILLRLVAGKRWADTEASTVLANYCYYIPLLAINGVTEAFVSATASNSTLNIQSAMMGVWFLAFGASTYLFITILNLGASSLVYANCMNMALRIVFNSYFINTFFKSSGLKFDFHNLGPKATSITHTVAVWAILRAGMISKKTLGSEVYQVVALTSLIGVYSLMLLYTERDFILPWIQPILDRYRVPLLGKEQPKPKQG